MDHLFKKNVFLFIYFYSRKQTANTAEALYSTATIFYYTYMYKYACIQIPIDTRHRQLEMPYGAMVAQSVWDQAERQESAAKVPLSKSTKLPVRGSLTLCHLSFNAHACL